MCEGNVGLLFVLQFVRISQHSILQDSSLWRRRVCRMGTVLSRQCWPGCSVSVATNGNRSTRHWSVSQYDVIYQSQSNCTTSIL